MDQLKSNRSFQKPYYLFQSGRGIKADDECSFSDAILALKMKSNIWYYFGNSGQ